MSTNDPGAPQTFPCRNCGHQLPTGTPICGNCGTIVQGGAGGGSPSVPSPLAASGIRPGAALAAIAVVVLVAGVFLARGVIGDAIDSVTESIEETVRGSTDTAPEVEAGGGGKGGGSNGGKGGGGGRPGNGNGGSDRGYRRIAEVVRDIRAGGVPCTDAKVDSSGSVTTGSCQSDGSHVQINLYLDPAAIPFAKDFYSDFAFASVHDDNWWVSGETALMARIQKALGGRLNRP